MRTRIEDAWEIFNKIHRRTKQREARRGDSKPLLTGLETGMKSLSVSQASTYRPELYIDAPTKMIWNSLVAFLCAVAGYVTIRDERFDEVLEILDPVLEREDVRSKLEACNADAVWLKLYRKGKGKEMDGAINKLPVGKWQFVTI
jgi:hypothetical protein